MKVIEQDYFTESKRDQNNQMFTESESAKIGYTKCLQKVKVPEQDFFLQKVKDTKQKSRESESATHLSDKVRCCHICTKTTKCLQKEKVLRW